MLRRMAAGLFGVMMAAAMPAWAGEGADALRAALYAGTLEDGIAQLTPLADQGDQEARFGVGLLTMLGSIEGLAQAFHRHGAALPTSSALGLLLGMPAGAPPSAGPPTEPLTYDAFRALIDDLVTGMDRARDSLIAAGESGDYVIPIEPLKLKMDFDGDGVAEDSESLAAIIGGMPGEGLAPPTSAGEPAMPDVTIGFDRADAIWLAGYSQVFALPGDFLLAHDFSEFFDVAFHRFFPRAGLMMQPYSGNSGGMLMLDPDTDTAIADAIAAVHTISWPVAEPARLKRVLERAKTVIAYSRRNWDAILAETDDDHELLPSPRQTPLDPEFAITEERVAAWRATLDSAERVLDGELLLPHWRFRQGFDLKAYFETAKRTDLVMLITGADALPYLRNGPVADEETFRAANEVFGGNLLGYSFWFN